MRQGQSKDDAERNALREYGDTAAARRELAAIDRRAMRKVSWREWIASFGQDIRFALRGLRARPGFTATAGMMTLFYTPYRCAHGIPKRIFDRLIAAGGAFPGEVISFDHEVFKSVAFEMVSEAGVEVLLHTICADVIMDGDRVCGLDEDNAVRVAIAVLHAAGFGGGSVLVTRGSRR